jgi:hypothetical protein
VEEKKHAEKEGKKTCRMRESNVECMQKDLTMLGLGILIRM